MAVIDTLLGALGVSGGVVSAVMILFTAWKGKHILDVLSHVAVWVRVGGAILVLVAIASTGLVPGIDLSVDVGAVAGWAGDILDLVGDVVSGVGL